MMEEYLHYHSCHPHHHGHHHPHHHGHRGERALCCILLDGRGKSGERVCERKWGRGAPNAGQCFINMDLGPFLTKTDKYSLSDKFKQIQTDEGRSTLIFPYHISEIHQCFCCFRTVAELGLEKHYFYFYTFSSESVLK